MSQTVGSQLLARLNQWLTFGMGEMLESFGGTVADFALRLDPLNFLKFPSITDGMLSASVPELKSRLDPLNKPRILELRT